ncbi:MAG TPA: HNH endonuclease [Dehalococcoidia bacterium]|nr:HNH endonuclease [Dehalococcoidia bacterium]
MPTTAEPPDRVALLLRCLGIDPSSFYSFVEWALDEQLVSALAQDAVAPRELLAKQDGLRQFRDILREHTKRDWSDSDLKTLFSAVRSRYEKHYRDPVTYGEYLKLLWSKPHRCAQCEAEPPGVVLHIDHVVPASLGGPSKAHNLQFLCAKCNLKKSNKLEGGQAWLNLQ